MEMLAASPALIARLRLGKYTRWAERRDEESLWAALWGVGEFGSRYWALKVQHGSFPAPSFEPHTMAENRMVRALWSFAILRGTGQLRLALGPHWDDEFSPTAPVFSQRYRDSLDLDPRTAWAASMDERSFASLLWEIGEYGVRVNSSHGPDGGEYAPPNFDGPPDEVRSMRAALKLIARVEGSARTTTAEAERVMSEV